MRTRRAARRGMRGQMMPIAALMAVVIFGGLALAVDLGVQTVSQRSLQNVSDAAALSGATDLGTTVDLTEQQSAVGDALATAQTNLGGSWSGSPSLYACTVGGISGYCGQGTEVVAGHIDYAVTVSTPPQSARSAGNRGLNDLEVEISTTAQNGLAAVIGIPVSTVAAHAVAYHWGPPQLYQYSFFAKQLVQSGNQQETIYGDAYVGDGYQAQSSGQAGLCVYDPVGTSGYGHMVYAVYPPTVGGEPTYDYSSTPCPGGGALTAQAAEPQAGSPNNCPAGVSAVEDPSTGSWGCVSANPPVPPVSGAACANGGPWQDPTSGISCVLLANGATINSTWSAGIYVVPPGGTVSVDFSNAYNDGNIGCVSLELDAGASVNILNKKTGQYMTSYGFSPDSIASGEISKLPQTPPSVSCAGAGLPGANCVICAAPTNTLPMPVALYNNSTGCCSDTLFAGSIFLPGQEIFFNTNQALEDVGSVYCGTWNVQSGNHPNPAVMYDPQNTEPEPEQLRLVE